MLQVYDRPTSSAAERSLATLFYDSYRGPRADDSERLAKALQRFLARGHAAWPSVSLDTATLSAYLGERAPVNVAPETWLDGTPAADLFLACACAAGVPAAIAAFDATFLCKLASYLGGLQPSAELVLETRQVLLDRLFVGSNGTAPKIRRYTGQGALGGWVRVIAVRTAIDLLSQEPANVEHVDEAGVIASALLPARDPEDAVIHARCHADFVAAFRAAILGLSRRDRAVLRYTFIEGLTPARIGVLYGVHRTTVMRWIDAAQEEVLARTRAALAMRLRLPLLECDDLVALIRSRLNITLSTLLATES